MFSHILCTVILRENTDYSTQEFKQQIVDIYNTWAKSFPQLELAYGVSKATMSGGVKQLSPVKISVNEEITAKE